MTGRRWLVLLGIGGLAAGALAGQATATSDRVDHRLTPFILLVGWSYIGAGILARRRRPANRFGLLMAGVGFAWFATMLTNSPHAVPYTAGAAVSTLFYAVLTHALVAYPTGRVTTRTGRRVVIAGYAVTLASTLAVLPFFRPSDYATGAGRARNLLLVHHHPDLVHAISSVAAVLGVALAGAVLGLLVQRWRSATPAARRVLAPVLVTTCVSVVVNAVALAVGVLLGEIGEWMFLIAAAAFITIPWAFLAGLLQTRLSQTGAVGELIARLGRDGRPDTVRDALRAALRDPTLDVRFWVPARDVFVDAEGRPCGPLTGRTRTVTTVRRDGRTVAQLVHDPILSEDAGMADTIVAAAGLALENAQLQAELRVQLQELRASERRLASVLENVHLIAISVDLDGAITFANRFFCDLVGWTQAELRGRSWVRTFNDGDQEFVDRVRAGTIFAHEESQLVTRAGARREVFWSNTLTRGSDGRVIGATSIGEDVTERKRAERDLRRLALEQAALRRVATLVAESADPRRVFRAVVQEVCGLLGAHGAGLIRFEDDATSFRVLAATGPLAAERGLVDAVVPIEPGTLMAGIRATGQPVRLDTYDGVAGPIAEAFRASGIGASIGAPIIVSGTLWGALEVSDHGPFPAGADARIAQFSELVAVALANADARDQLAASRARIVQASDAERRRLERNLHDGAQQRLVSLSLALRLARERVDSEPAAVQAMLEAASRELAQALEELRELARGIHPAVLTDRGLRHALEVLANRSPVPVTLVADGERLPPPVEAALYYVASEALANIVKHARAAAVEVRVSRTSGGAVVEVADDGLGGARASAGSGLAGLADRVEALGGQLTVRSPAGGGTTVRAEVPLASSELRPPPAAAARLAR